MNAQKMSELLRSLSIGPGAVVFPSAQTSSNGTLPKFEGHYAPSSVDISALNAISVGELKPNHRHSGRVIFLDLLHATEDDGLLLKAMDNKGATCDLWLLVLHPVFAECGNMNALGSRNAIAIKEPYFALSPTGKLCIRVDHPMDAELVASSNRKDIGSMGPTAEGGASFLVAGNRAFLDGNKRHALEFYSCGINGCPSKPASDINTKEILELLQKRSFTYTRLGKYKEAGEDADAMLAIDPADAKALRLSISCLLETGSYEQAMGKASILHELGSENVANQQLLARAETRYAEQTAGKYDLMRMLRLSHTASPVRDSATFCGNVEKRRSALGGNGLFATGSLEPGDLVLCERPLAITSHLDKTFTRDGLVNLLPGVKTGSRKLALLQKLAARTVGDSASLKSLFELCDGTPDEARNHDEPISVFDSYRVLRIIKHNAHTVFPGALSDQHSLYDPGNTMRPKHLLRANEQQLGLWLKASLFNHSCVPNVFWAFIGDAIVARAIRHIERDEELTIAYMPSDTSAYERRKNGLEAYQIKCACVLCKADVKYGKARQSLDKLTPVPRTSPDSPSRNTYGSVAKKALLNALKATLQTYDRSAYFGRKPPAISLASPFVQVAHDVLGPIATWSLASVEQIDRATIIFRSCLVLGLGIHVTVSSVSPFWHIVRGPYSQPKAAGVIALVGLAELAYHAGSTERCTALVNHARQLYEICYGEIFSFEEKHENYECMKVATLCVSPSDLNPAIDASVLFEDEVGQLLAFWQDA